MAIATQSNGEVDPALLDAFRAQAAPAQAEFLASIHRRNCLDILSADAISPELRTKAIHGQIHLTEVSLFSEPVTKKIDRARRLAESGNLFSPNKGEAMRQATEAVIQAEPEALVARLQAVEWLREILPEDRRQEFDVEAMLAVGDVEGQIESLVGTNEVQRPEEARRLVGALAIAS